MRTSAKNIIKKQLVEFNVSSNAPVLQLQQQLQEWCSRELLPQLEERLEPYASIPDVIRIDELVVQVDYEGQELEQLTQKIMEELLRQLPTPEQKTANAVATKPARSFFELLLFYLEHGHLPWWSGIASKTEFEKQLQHWIMEDIEPAAITLFKAALQRVEHAKRLLSVVPAPQRWLLFEKIGDARQVRQIRDALLALENAVRTYASSDFMHPGLTAPIYEMIHSAVHARLLDWIINSKMNVKPFPFGNIIMNALHASGYTAPDVQKIFQESKLEKNELIDVTFDGASRPVQHEERSLPLRGESELPAPGKKAGKEDADEEIYISNAGLVLVARYLPGFFERTGLRQDDQFVHPALAVAAIQWMANGCEEPAEFELVLPKILCGLQPNENLPQVNEIPAFIKQEATEMLESLIRHWSILKNTSVPGLQASFLQRQGKLSRINDQWLLQVEQKPYDMLLEHLPWTIGIIKLSFMKDAVYVEWAN